MTTSSRGLPVRHLTELVGRDRVLNELSSLVASRRLVTITGQAGVGKSRTAARLAEMLRRSFGGSIAVVEMGGQASDRAGETIAAAVGSPGASLEEIARILGEKPHLIVLDNLDRADLAAPALEQLLRHATETRLVVTSRQRTGIRGETLYVLSPLESILQGPPEAALESPAGNLLLRLIREEDPTFRATAAAAEELLAVCKATDGVPRFIEAAARAVCVLGPRAAAIAVTEDAAVLDSFLPTAFHAMTSKAVLQGALARVSEPARRLLQRLSLFASGCDLRFAADLFSDGSVAKIAGPTSELVDQSLVRSETVGGERRLRVPLHYRGHTLGSWDEESRSSEQQRVRSALIDRMRHCAGSWFSDDQLQSIQFLNRHAGDITALLSAMSADPNDAHEALDIISALRYYWQLHPVDPWPRVRDWLGTALTIDPTHDSITVRAMQTDAYIAFHEGDLEGARAQLMASRSGSDPSLIGDNEALFGIFVEALIDLGEGNPAAAEPKLGRVLRESLQADVEHLGEKYWFLATCQIAMGHEETAMASLAEGLAFCEQVGDIWGRAYMWWLVALIAGRQGRTNEATARLRESVDVMSDYGDRAGLALCVRLLVSISGNNGEDESVARLAALFPRQMHTSPPVPLPELVPAPPSTFGPSTPLQDNRSLGEMLARIIDGDAAENPTQRDGTLDALSGREWEIATLVAEGLGNPAIAARLVLSRRTVEGHVQRILAKLGFRSRSQIAVWVAQSRTEVGRRR
ncbi:LuxR C-terminal-related transcriptional regulator [Arthrobacter sp. 2RAF6]|uniref:LuxR C-terminal-related transcriptional regulator n=1 Tax=Arthrobacter sp. 2RAF6 TaxID=3233002 RepID=UPI003F9236AD